MHAYTFRVDLSKQSQMHNMCDVLLLAVVPSIWHELYRTVAWMCWCWCWCWCWGWWFLSFWKCKHSGKCSGFCCWIVVFKLCKIVLIGTNNREHIGHCARETRGLLVVSSAFDSFVFSTVCVPCNGIMPLVMIWGFLSTRESGHGNSTILLVWVGTAPCVVEVKEFIVKESYLTVYHNS